MGLIPDVETAWEIFNDGFMQMIQEIQSKKGCDNPWLILFMSVTNLKQGQQFVPLIGLFSLAFLDNQETNPPL